MYCIVDYVLTVFVSFCVPSTCIFYNPSFFGVLLTSSSFMVFLFIINSPVGITLDVPNGKLYFTDRYADNIKRANLDGSNVEIVIKTKYPVDLAIDYDKREIYWTARPDGAVFKASIDSTDIVDASLLTPIVTGLTSPIGVDLDRVNKKCYCTEMSIEHDKDTGKTTKTGVIWESNYDGSSKRKVTETPLPLGICYRSG